MRFSILEDCGEIGTEYGTITGAGSRTVKRFLDQLLEQFVLRSTQYYKEIDEHLFYYRERQLHSVISPSIAHMTPTFLMEHPLDRKPAGEDEYRGCVDYWIYYHNYSFLLELKHTFFAYTKAYSPREKITEKFERALKQLENIRVGQCRDLNLGNGLRKIALETIVFYRRKKQKSELIADLENCDFKELFDALLQNTGLAETANFHALWILADALVEPEEIASVNSFEIYPAVAFVGNITDVIS